MKVLSVLNLLLMLVFIVLLELKNAYTSVLTIKRSVLFGSGLVDRSCQ